MNERFLRAKHWQLFLLIFGFPFFGQLFVMGLMFSNIGWQTEINSPFSLSYFAVFPIVMLAYVAIFYGWFWAMGVGLQSKVPEGVNMKVGRFKFFFFTPIVYFLLLMGVIFIGTYAATNGAFENNPSPEPYIGLVFLLIPLHLFAMFCSFYCLYFVSKTIKTVELQREASFSDYVGEFFLLWFYPIGIWIIQPKINKMMEEG